MLKVLDLFAGTQSVRKALTAMLDIYCWLLQPNGVWWGFDEVQFHTCGNHCVEYIGIDIYSPDDQNIIIDLTSDFALDMIKNRLGNWIPDFIWSSPVCNTFSTTITGKGGNLYFINEGNGVIRPRRADEKEGIQKQLVKFAGSPEYIAKAELALKMHKRGKEIIDDYNVPFAIENPAIAMSKHLYGDYVANTTNYCMYGFSIKKPTNIYSNKPLNLLKCNHTGKHSEVISRTRSNVKLKSSSYAIKSAVPESLIIEIIEQLTKKEA